MDLRLTQKTTSAVDVRTAPEWRWDGARNKLKRRIAAVVKGAATTIVHIDIGGPIVTSSVTNEAAEGQGLKQGWEVFAVIKARDVMAGVE